MTPLVDNDALKDLTHRFAYHKPKDEATAHAHAFVRESCLRLARMLWLHLPDGREKSLFVTKIEEAMFWANAAIARSKDNKNDV